MTLTLNLSSSSNLEVSNNAQHVPNRTAPEFLNDPQNRKQLKVAAQDPLAQTYTWITSSMALFLVSFELLFRDVSVRLFGGERASLILTKESAKFACPDLPFVGLCGNA